MNLEVTLSCFGRNIVYSKRISLPMSPIVYEIRRR